MPATLLATATLLSMLTAAGVKALTPEEAAQLVVFAVKLKDRRSHSSQRKSITRATSKTREDQASQGGPTGPTGSEDSGAARPHAKTKPKKAAKKTKKAAKKTKKASRGPLLPVCSFCQGLHVTSSCTANAQRCGVCASEHPTELCIRKLRAKAKISRGCANCQSKEHSSPSYFCPARRPTEPTATQDTQHTGRTVETPARDSSQTSPAPQPIDPETPRPAAAEETPTESPDGCPPPAKSRRIIRSPEKVQATGCKPVEEDATSDQELEEGEMEVADHTKIAQHFYDEYHRTKKPRQLIRLYTGKKAPKCLQGRVKTLVPLVEPDYEHFPEDDRPITRDPVNEASAIRDYLEHRGVEILGIHLKPGDEHFAVYTNTHEEGEKITKFCPDNDGYSYWVHNLWRAQVAEDSEEEDNLEYESEDDA